MGARSTRSPDPAAGWVFLPVAGMFLTHAPVLRYDLFRRLKRPIDGGLELRGRRLLGDNKTWRGAIVMFASTFGATLALARRRWFRERLPEEVAEAPPAAYAALLGLAVVAGELPTSLVKRQLGIAPGERGNATVGALFAVYDQGNIVLAGSLALRPIWRPSAGELAGAFLTYSGVHFVVNVVGYAIGAREHPI